jgi:hypothetical protein
VPRLAEWLADHRPEHTVDVRLSSWSCAHGVERWRSDCGCHTGGEPGWNQTWRAPLREALDVIRDHAIGVMEERGRELLRDPWEARDAYIAVLLGAQTIDEFASEHVTGDRTNALTLLEASRHALLMYTSCGWFFNDLAGIETLQVLRYAARCIDLLDELGRPAPVDRFLEVLGRAHSNRPDEADGRKIWERHVLSSRIDASRVAAHLALVALLHPNGDDPGVLGGHVVERNEPARVDRGGVAACAGRVTLLHRRTRRRTTHAYAALLLGGLEVFGATRVIDGDGDDDPSAAFIETVVAGERVTALLRRVVEDFGPDEFGIEAALPEAVDQIGTTLTADLTQRFTTAYRRLHDDHAATLAALAAAGYQVPDEVRVSVALALTRELEDELARVVDDLDPSSYRTALEIAARARAAGVGLDSPRARVVLDRALRRAVDAALADPDREHVDAAVAMVRLVRELAVVVDVGPAQEVVHDALLGGGARAELAPLGAALGLGVDRIGTVGA